jgi:hypothetical protein
MLSLIARCNRTALAASSVALASAAAVALSQRKEEDASTTSGRSKSIDLTTSVCSCDALKVPTVKRQQTMVWLGKTSSKASLESRYKVRFDVSHVAVTLLKFAHDHHTFMHYLNR